MVFLKRKKKLLITSTSFAKTTQEAIKELESNNFETHWAEGPFNDYELSNLINGFDAIIIGNDIVGKKSLNNNENLKAVVKHGVGIDNIDSELANKKGIKIINAKHTNSIAVAEFVFATLLSLIRKVCIARESLLHGKWEGAKFIGEELYGKAMGIIGMGHIGQNVAKISNGFGMKVSYFDIIRNKEIEQKTGIHFFDLTEIIKESDIISIHIPLSKDTVNLIGKYEISQMKSIAYLINMSRGGIIDEEALYDALKIERIKGAILDVYSKQPVDKDWKILKLNNVLCTPHHAGYTFEGISKTTLSVAEQLIEYFNKLENSL